MSADRTDPHTGRTFGEVVPPRSTEGSKIERQVAQFLRDAGYPVPERPIGVLCHHPEEGKSFLTLTPDVVFEEWRLALEVDPCDPFEYGSTHFGEESKDRLRNDLLGAVGWSVIRLRLSAPRGGHIGDRDVVVQSSTFTKAAQAALIDAIEDFKSNRKARVRFVPKVATASRPAQRRSQVANLGEHRYSDDGHIFNWYPSLEGPEKTTLRLCLNGRYLYTHEPAQRFVMEVGLHEVPREQWKQRLTEALADRPQPIHGTTKWPWGNSLLIRHSNSDAAATIVEQCDHSKNFIDRGTISFTVSDEPAPRWSPEGIYGDDDQPIVTLHPDAVTLGYRLAEVSTETGYRGTYQRITITRETR